MPAPRFSLDTPSSAGSAPLTIGLDSTEAIENDSDVNLAALDGIIGTNIDRGFFESLVATTAGGAVDLADTVGASIGITQRGTIDDSVANFLGGPGLVQAFRRNRDAAEVGSGILGVIGAFTGAGATLTAARGLSVVRNAPFVGQIARIETQHQNALRLARVVDLDLASRGQIGASGFVGQLNYARLGQPGLNTTVQAVRRNVVSSKLAQGFAQNALTEVYMAGLLNENSFLYSDSLAENLGFAAAGLIAGAALDGLQAVHALNTIANSNETRRQVVKALDPFGTETARLQSTMRSLDVDLNTETTFGALGGNFTDLATSFHVSAGELSNKTLASSKKIGLFESRNDLATSFLQEGRNTIQKFTTKGVAGVEGSAFSMKEEGFGNAVDFALYKDAEALLGLEEIAANREFRDIGTIHAEREGVITARRAELQESLARGGTLVTRTRLGKKVQVVKPFTEEESAAIADELKLIDYRSKLVPQVLLNGEWVPRRVGEMFKGFKLPEIKIDRLADLELFSDARNPKGDAIGIMNDLRLRLPKGKKIHTMELMDTISLFHSANKLIDSFAKRGERMLLPRNPEWFQLDVAEELIKRTGRDDLVVFPNAMTREDAIVESLSQKAKIIKESKALKNSDSITAHSIRMKLNLPRLTSFEAGLHGTETHPVEHLLNQIADAATGDGGAKLTFSELQSRMAEIRRITEISSNAKNRTDEFVGGMFTFMQDDNGKFMAPILGYSRPFQEHTWTKDNLAHQLAIQKAHVRSILSAPNAGPLTKELHDAVVNSPDFAILANGVASLSDSQLQTFMPFQLSKAPQETSRGLVGAAVSSEFRDRNQQVLLAASRLNDTLERKTRAIYEREFRTSMGDILDRVNGPANSSSRALLDQFFTFRSGWDLATKTKQGVKVPVTKTVQLPNGKTIQTFVLEKSQANANRWRKQFGTDIPDGATLRTPRGIEVGLDELGFEAAQRFDNFAAKINQEKNTLLRATGVGEINQIPVYTPPPNTRGKILGLTIDLQGNAVPGGTVIADTPAEFARQKAILLETEGSPLKIAGNRFFTSEEILNFNSIWDKAQQNFQDPGLTAIQPGKRNRGVLQGQETRVGAFGEALLWSRDQFLKHTRDFNNVFFKDQLVAARSRARFTRQTQIDKITGRDVAATRNIFDFFEENLLGKTKVKSPGSIIGKVTQPIEQTVNSLLREGKFNPANVFRAADKWVSDRDLKNNTKKAKDEFNQLANDLAKFSPFNDASEIIAQRFGKKPPAELDQIVGQLNRFEATMRLRMFEPIHAIMNLSGIVNALPSVIRHTMPFQNEDAAAWANRIGHSATIFDLDDGKKIGIIDMAKIGMRSFDKAWNRKALPDWEFRVQHGYMSQEVAEFHKQMSLMDTREGWRKALFGTPNGKTNVERKGVVGLVSVLSDQSEDFSRSWGHMVGIELADFLGIAGRANREAFAHDIANKMIANYNPKNRPEIFQGALGAPIGLFQSFIFNYYQRLFRYAETGDAVAFGTQMAMQAGLFGVASVPGFETLNEFIFNDNDNRTYYDGIFNRFGSDVGDVLAHGVLSNLPKLANLLPGVDNVPGIELYSRGDTNIRLPGFNWPPIVDTIKRIKTAIGRGVSAFSVNNPNLTSNQIAEILSNMLTNRPIAGFIETQFAHGFDTDDNGAVVNISKTLMEQTARMMGVRTLQQGRELEAFFSNTKAQATQRALMDELNASSRAAIRDGDYESLLGFYAEYVERGGNPNRFNQWMKRNIEAGLSTRGERQLKQLLRSQNPNAQRIQRLLDAEVSVNEMPGDVLEQNPYLADFSPEDEDSLELGDFDPVDSDAEIDTDEETDPLGF